jgi:hypothetical protein
MRKLLFFVCLLSCFKTASAQEIIKLQTDSSANIRKLIIPTYDNLFKLLKASSKDYDATLLSLGYVRKDEGDSYAYYARSEDKNLIFSVIKQDKEVDIAFNVHIDYPLSMKEAFLKKFTDPVHKRIKGMDAYFFDQSDDSGATVSYCMLFDISKKDGGVTLLKVD